MGNSALSTLWIKGVFAIQGFSMYTSIDHVIWDLKKHLL